MAYFDSDFFDSDFFETEDPVSFGPSVADQFLAHDAVLVWLTKQDRDVVLAVRGQTAPPPSVVDTVTGVELALVQIGVTPNINDSLVASELVAVLMGLPVFVLESAPPAELVTVSLNLLTLSVNDSALAAELAMASFGLEVSVFDSNPPTDVVSLQLGLVVFDDISVGEAAVVQIPLRVNVLDDETPSEFATTQSNVVLVTAADSSIGTDVASLHRNFVVQVFDDDVVDERRFAAMQKVRKVKIHPVQGP